MDDGIIVLHHHNALVGVEFEPVPDEEQRRIRAGFLEMGVRRNRLEQRALQRRLNRKGFGKTILMSIFIGKA